MTDTRKDDAPPPQPELSDEQLDTAVGGATQTITDGTSNISDGTSNVKDGTSNTIFIGEKHR